MKNRNVIMLLAAAALAWLPVAADETYDKLLKELEAMKANQEQLQKRLADQDAQLREMREQMDQGAAQVKDMGPVVKLRKNGKSLELKGDLRIRGEQIKTDDESSEDDDEVRQFRHRFRLGMMWNTTDGWQIGAGLATGGTSPVSTNHTWNGNDFWETGDIRLDYAYAIHSWGPTTVCLGQQVNPYKHAGLTFDADVRPTGVTVKNNVGPAFVTSGAYSVRHVGANEAEAALFAVQAGAKLGGNTTQKGTKLPTVTLAAAFYYFNEAASTETQATGDNNFHIVSLYWDVVVPIGVVELGLFGEASRNIGSGELFYDNILGVVNESQLASEPGGSFLDPSEDNDAAMIGARVKVGRLSGSYAYMVCEADALYNPVKDADYNVGGVQSDVKGHVIKGSVKLTQNLSLDGTVFLLDRDNGDEVDNDKMSHYRLEFLYKF